jgi:hypothetical protein
MANLASYRTRISNSLDDTTSKYSTAVIDEALRKVLNTYTRSTPNIQSHVYTITAAGSTQTLAAANLITVIQLIPPYVRSSADPFRYQREDYYLAFVDGSPALYFTGSEIPQVGESLLVKYAGKQTITDLDSAVSTTVRDDHEDILVVGAAGQAAMMRASGLNEQWGGRAGEMSSLMTWGTTQYQTFNVFIEEIKQEVSIPLFPSTYWNLDEWDNA